MGFFENMAKGIAQSAQDRVQNVSVTKAEFEDKYKYASDEEIFRTMSRVPVSSPEFAALSLILQDRGHSSEEIVKRVKNR